jgi:hypothetical protein
MVRILDSVRHDRRTEVGVAREGVWMNILAARNSPTGSGGVAEHPQICVFAEYFNLGKSTYDG